MADLIWTDKFTGDAKVWYNLGQRQESDRIALGGSLFEWARPSKVYQGSSRGPNMYYPSLGGQGRADMVGSNPTTAHVSGTPSFLTLALFLVAPSFSIARLPAPSSSRCRLPSSKF